MSIESADCLLEMEYRSECCDEGFTDGELKESKGLYRIAFDRSNDRFLFAEVGEGIVMPCRDGKLGEEKTFRTENAFVFKNGKARQKVLLNPPTQVSEVRLERLLEIFAVPSLEHSGLSAFGTRPDSESMKGVLAAMRSGNCLESLTLENGRPSNVRFELLIKPGYTSKSSWNWDPKCQLPSSWEMGRDVTVDGRTQYYPAFTETFKWKSINDVFAPSEITVRKVRGKRLSSGILAYEDRKSFVLHWLSINEDLSEELFDMGAVESSTSIRSLVHPKVTGLIETHDSL